MFIFRLWLDCQMWGFTRVPPEFLPPYLCPFSADLFIYPALLPAESLWQESRMQQNRSMKQMSCRNSDILTQISGKQHVFRDIQEMSPLSWRWWDLLAIIFPFLAKCPWISQLLMVSAFPRLSLRQSCCQSRLVLSVSRWLPWGLTLCLQNAKD